MKYSGPRRIVVIASLCLTMMLLMIVAGCTTSSTKKGNSLTLLNSRKIKGPVPQYYDFGDVLIPSELTTIKEDSFVFKTLGLTAGVLSLKGRVDLRSLIKFFDGNMRKDHWKPVSSFKSVRSILLFQKDTRWCVISITEKAYHTYVEVWVAPTNVETGITRPAAAIDTGFTSQNTSTGLLKSN